MLWDIAVPAIDKLHAVDVAGCCGRFQGRRTYMHGRLWRRRVLHYVIAVVCSTAALDCVFLQQVRLSAVRWVATHRCCGEQPPPTIPAYPVRDPMCVDGHQ